MQYILIIFNDSYICKFILIDIHLFFVVFLKFTTVEFAHVTFSYFTSVGEAEGFTFS